MAGWSPLGLGASMWDKKRGNSTTAQWADGPKKTCMELDELCWPVRAQPVPSSTECSFKTSGQNYCCLKSNPRILGSNPGLDVI